MSIERLFNHKVRVYRKPELLASRQALGSTSKVPVAVTSAPTRFNARPDQDWTGVQQDKGPGELQATKRRWFLDKGLDVRDRDILSVIEGPEAGVNLEVESTVPTTNPRRVHHIEVNVDVWKGVLP